MRGAFRVRLLGVFSSLTDVSSPAGLPACGAEDISAGDVCVVSAAAEGEILGDDFDIEEELEATQNGGLISMDQPSPQPNEA